MRNIFKSKDGVVLPIAIILSTVGIVLFTAVASYTLQNYKTIRANNLKSNVYYIADYGMERVIKNLETIVESAKISANEKVRIKPSPTVTDPYPKSDYDKLLSGELTQEAYNLRFEGYFKDYLINVPETATPLTPTKDITQKLTIPYPISFTSSPYPGYPGSIGLPGLPNAQYTATVTTTDSDSTKQTVLSSAEFGTNYTLVITVSGSDNGKYKRTVKANVCVNPWGFNNTAGTAATDLNVEDKDTIYASPQWTSALASSGDILVKGGKVTVEGDIYVNGKTPLTFDDPTTGLPYTGSNYGGLVVGDPNGIKGDLTVFGNVFSNNFVHTMYPGSTINVNFKSAPDTIDQIYDRIDGTGSIYYSEKVSNLILDGNNPLKLLDGTFDDLIVNYEGKRTINKVYADYVKDTYKIQKKNGGFIYASDVEVEQNDDAVTDTTPQNINVQGSVIASNNIEIDNIGTITVGHNFYGFRDSIKGSNESSSIVTNHPDGKIQILGRIYNTGIAYVTSYDDKNGNGTRQDDEYYYKTGEAISLYKNFYSYRTNLSNINNPSGDTYSEVYDYDNHYNPFNFLDFASKDIKLGTPATPRIKAIYHVLAYNEQYNPITDMRISEGGQAYDKNMIILNKDIYSNANLGINTKDMGYANGVLMGTVDTSTGETFTGYISSDIADPIAHGFMDYYRASGSLTQMAFERYIQGKYNILSEIKALQYKDWSPANTYKVYLDDLVDKTMITDCKKYDDETANFDANFIVANQDITITANDTSMTIKYGDGTTAETISTTVNDPADSKDYYVYKGLILSTGKITIENISLTKGIKIDGAVVSAIAPNLATEIYDAPGIEFKGNGIKKIVYNQQTMLNIFRLPTPEAQKIKEALTSARGIIEMFKKVYAQQAYWDSFSPALDGDKDFKNAIDTCKVSGDSNFAKVNVPSYTSSEGVTYPAKEITNIPVDAITRVANLYEIYSQSDVGNPTNINDKVVLYQSVLDTLLQGNKNYKILRWGTTN